MATAEIKAKQKGVVAGLGIAKEVFWQLDRRIKFTPQVKDGKEVKSGTVLARLAGPARGILTGERTALNFLQHLSGIATLTREFGKKVESGTLPTGRQAWNAERRTRILDTRKTTPGLRVLEKYAVKMGGGTNHRMGLHDAILIKDNHIKIAGGIKKAVEKAQAKTKAKDLEVETKNLFEVQAAISAGVGRILLDNMDIKTMKKAVALCRKAKIKTEASGGVSLKNIRQIAATGVDYVSIGALTHSAPALDISLKIV
jgi:nicotinate-nucleotide pyrophosphorylase (carboxylating)